MKRIVLFDPSNGTFNSGDEIIRECINEEMSFLFKDSIIARIGTHTPICHWYQRIKKNLLLKTCEKADYKFLCGTNLFKNSLIRFSPDWSINVSSIPYYKNCISIGCGMDMNSKKSNFYTKKIYRKILNKEIIHSVRDERTKKFLEDLGFSVINTGCPTMWWFDDSKCKKIPMNKSKSVVFTITDYKRDYEKDKILIKILRENYDKLFFWIQGYDDLDYLRELTDLNDISLINHDLDSYRTFLEKNDVDYVGTRLHAGIYAMRHYRRSIIIGVDNRANDIKLTYNIPFINRSEISDYLSQFINKSFETSIVVNHDNINKWKSQFVK